MCDPQGARVAVRAIHRGDRVLVPRLVLSGLCGGHAASTWRRRVPGSLLRNAADQADGELRPQRSRRTSFEQERFVAQCWSAWLLADAKPSTSRCLRAEHRLFHRHEWSSVADAGVLCPVASLNHVRERKPPPVAARRSRRDWCPGTTLRAAQRNGAGRRRRRWSRQPRQARWARVWARAWAWSGPWLRPWPRAWPQPWVRSPRPEYGSVCGAR
mmetsp:Transcript_249/g.707  ORF Transcript_249/g.707 Transcript_249/m.707 type:complete len:214 (-) Transcript_249:146-787(-)